MKLRFVKFFTSRENEIEKKEGGEGRSRTTIVCSVTQLARSPLPALVLLFSSSFPFSPSTQPHQPASPRPSLSAATDRESNALQLSLPQLSRFSPSSS